jgi:hypothetical protein
MRRQRHLVVKHGRSPDDSEIRLLGVWMDAIPEDSLPLRPGVRRDPLRIEAAAPLLQAAADSATNAPPALLRPGSSSFSTTVAAIQTTVAAIQRSTHGGRMLLQAVILLPQGSKGAGACYRRRPGLLHMAAGSATGRGRVCYWRRPGLLHTAAGFASGRGRVCYTRRQGLLHTAAGSATGGARVCYTRRQVLLPTAPSDATDSGGAAMAPRPATDSAASGRRSSGDGRGSGGASGVVH